MAGSPELSRLLGRPVLDVAPRLLGAVLRHDTPDGTVAVRLTEVEAYDGSDDPGSHAYRGQTDRNRVMFGPAGRLYVYFTYGMHYCCNVVAGGDGTASAVLLRAGEVVEGVETARRRRQGPRSLPPLDRDLARGPARLCEALAIDHAQNGADLARPPLTLLLGEPVADNLVRRGPRVGLREAADRPWRFWVEGHPTVSSYRAHVPKRRA